VLRRLSKRREISSVIAVTPDGRLAAWHVRGSVKGPTTCRALRHFRQVFRRPLLVIWDRGTAHTACEVQAFLAAHPRDFAAARLPAYAPELNPEEQANALIKRRMANAVPASLAELKAHACRGIRYLQRHPTLVQHFFAHAGLPVSIHHREGH
jgi:transposase